jgi:hypothetical protein
MNQKGMDASFLETASFWSNIAVVALTVLAAIAGALALYFSSRLSALKDADLAKFQAESKAAISVADARGAEANAKAADAAKGTAEALLAAAGANERAGKIEVEAASQRERAAKAERELLALQQRLAWRELTPEQERRFVTELSRFAGTRVAIMTLGEAEASKFGEQIKSVLTAARWSLAVSVAGLVSPPPYGVICTHTAGDAAAASFVGLLKSANVIVSERIANGFQILIGLKPPA